MKKPVKISLSIIFVVAVAGVVTAVWLFNKKPADLRKTKPDLIVTAPMLQKEFEENEAEAVSKYVNKILEVTGTIVSIKKEREELPTITLKTDSDFSSVICTLNSSENIASMTPGNEVTIRGECSGFLLDVLLNNCAVIEK
jgi:hypothetical protein